MKSGFRRQPWSNGQSRSGAEATPAVQARMLRARVVATGGRTPAPLRWALILFVLAIPFEAIDIGFGGFLSPARVAALPFFIVSLFVPKLCFRLPSAAVWWFLAYLGVVAVAGLYTPPSLLKQTSVVFLSKVQLVIFFWIASNLFRDKQLATQVLRGYAVATIALALGVLAGAPGFAVTSATKEIATAQRLTALDYNPNALATMVAVAAVIVLGEFFRTTKLRNRLFIGTAAVPLVLLIVRTGSRSGVLAFLAGLAVFLIPAGGTGRGVGASALAAVLLLGAAYLAITDPLMEARLSAAYEQGDSRDRIYTVALQMISERPLVGWGPAYGFYTLGRRVNYVGKALDAHSLPLYLLLEVGIVGTVPVFVGLWLVFRAAWRARRGPLGVLPLALVTVLLMANLAHTSLARKPMWLVLAVGLASVGSDSRGRGTAVRRRTHGKSARARAIMRPGNA